MLRVIVGAGTDDVHVENRVGDPAANPYLYVASQLVAGLDGVRHGREPPTGRRRPVRADAGPLLPRSLGEALAAFEAIAAVPRGVG